MREKQKLLKVLLVHQKILEEMMYQKQGYFCTKCGDGCDSPDCKNRELLETSAILEIVMDK